MSSKFGKNLAMVYGIHAVQAVLEAEPERAIQLWVVDSGRNPKLLSLCGFAESLGLPIQRVHKEALVKRFGKSHQGVALETRPREQEGERELEMLLAQQSAHALLFLILDQVQDPHNFGACLRTADAAGVAGVIVPRANSSPMTPVVQKVASGAAETMRIFRVANLARTMELLKQQGVWLIGTSDQAEQSLYELDLRTSVGVVMGAEGRGLRPLTARQCDALVSLPMSGKIVSSLNVSVATGVCLYEVVRQRAKLSGTK